VVRIRARKFELSLLQHLFLGRGWNLFFTVTVALDLYGITWAFCSIFGAALADQVPFPGVSWSYELWILVFVLVAIPLSCTSLLDQLYVQLAFLAARLLMVLFMISTLLAAFAHPAGAYFGDQVGPAHDVPLADWSRAIQATTVCCFATAFQFSVPAVGHVSSDKRVLSRIFGSAVAFVFLSNLILALLTAVYFGTATDPSNNLNWAAYHASPFLSKYIVLFAAIDGIAVYPLIAISLGGILMGAVYGEGMLEAELDWKRRTLFRFLASVPQAVGAVFVRDLGAIALYAGIFTVISYTIAPSVLCIASYRRMAGLRASTRTAYSTVVSEASHVKLAYALILISVLLIIGVIVDSFFHREK
jgi:amino acid permease